MSAPNKIYVSADPFGFMHAYDAENYPPDGEAYIRKDYLLEWINKARAVPHENAITRDLAFQEVVNKLNSM